MPCDITLVTHRTGDRRRMQPRRRMLEEQGTHQRRPEKHQNTRGPKTDREGANPDLRTHDQERTLGIPKQPTPCNELGGRVGGEQFVCVHIWKFCYR